MRNRKKYEVVKLDLPLDVMKNIKLVAKHCNLTQNKVINVIITLRLAQMGLLK